MAKCYALILIFLIVRIFEGNKSRAPEQSQLTALQWRLKTTDIRSSIEGGLFLEHISSKKNAINLNCKFAFINYMVGIHTLLYYNKKKA